MRGVSQPIWHFIRVDTTENDGRWVKGLLLLVFKFSCNIRHKIRSSKGYWYLSISFETEVQPHNPIQLLPNTSEGVFTFPTTLKFCWSYWMSQDQSHATVLCDLPSWCFFGCLIWDTCWGSWFQNVPPKQNSQKMQKRLILSLLSANNSHLNSHPESLLPDRIWARCSLFPEDGPTHATGQDELL